MVCVCGGGGAGHRLQLGLHTSRRTELVPRRDRVPLGVAWVRHGHKAGPPRLPFSFLVVCKFLQKKKITDLKSGNPLGNWSYF